jgi:hypothetical protein
MSTVDYLPVATGGSANVISQATFAAAPWVGTGFQSGLAQSNQANKVWRQSSMVAAMIANFISQANNQNVLDDGNLSNLIAAFEEAIQQIAVGAAPSRIVTSSANFSLLLTDFNVGLNRTVAPAATSIQVPTGAAIGQRFEIDDLAATASQYNITILPPAGHTFAGRNSYVVNVDRRGVRIKYYGSSIWALGTVDG